MTLQVTGTNVDAGESYRSYVADRVDQVIEKYLGREVSTHIRLEKERNRFVTNCTMRLTTGLTMQSEGEGNDAYSSADASFEKLEKRLRRYKRRLKSHHTAGLSRAVEFGATDYVLRSDEDEGPEADDHAPLVIAETQLTIRELPVSEAVMSLDLAEQPFLVFRNAANGQLNVVYKRQDGNVGWIDPTSSK